MSNFKEILKKGQNLTFENSKALNELMEVIMMKIQSLKF